MKSQLIDDMDGFAQKHQYHLSALIEDQSDFKIFAI